MTTSSFQTFQTLILFSFTLLYISSLSDAAKQPNKPNAFNLPVKKDTKTNEYYTSINLGTPQVTLNLVLHLGERFVWYECGDNYNSSSYNPVRCGTKKCKSNKSTGCITCDRPLKTGCTNNTCGIDPFNPFQEFWVSGDFGEDILSLYSTDSARALSRFQVPSFLSVCVYPAKFGVEGFLGGLNDGSKGILGLARTPITLPAQLATKYKLPRKFALCLPSSNKKGFGSIFIGGGSYYIPPHDASKFLVSTPILTNPVSTGPVFGDGSPSIEYFIGVKSINVDNKVVSLNTSMLSIDKDGNGGTKISTVKPFTVLQSSIYNALVDDFVKKAAAKKMKRVASVSPFTACFDSSTVGKTVAGPAVPAIDLVLDGGVHWKIYGGNSMVRAGSNTLCLGFVDGGAETTTSIVIGGHQLEDNLVEFDLENSKLSLSSSLLLRKASCSHFRVF